ncbi:MAG: YfdX family protein [Proteobacteria bacterium]|nr:YfdX family protein [Pseudomonadota bacterium]
MKRRTQLAVGLALGIAAASPALNFALAADTKPAAAAEAAKAAPANAAPAAAAERAKAVEMVRASDELYSAVRQAHGARLAIFQGQPEEARKLVADAMKNLNEVKGKAADFALATSKGKDSGDTYVPFDSSIALAEGFQPTKEKVEKVKQANEHIAKGDRKKAVETLKLANVDVVFSAAVLPINATVKHVADATTLLSEGKYYEANLALKAIEDSAILESFGADSVPVQGKRK